jgi:hypothetical protein
MKDMTHDHAHRKAIYMTATERKMLKMLGWHRLAIKAHSRWVESMDRLNQYDQDAPQGVAWTWVESREEIFQKAIDHMKAHLYCLDKAEQIKMTL